MTTISSSLLFFIVLLCDAQLSAQQTETTATVQAPTKLTISAAIDEAMANNLGLFAERANLTIAEAALLTAQLKPNPVLSLSAEHLDPSYKVFYNEAAGGPPEFSLRIDVPIELGNKRQLRVETVGFEKEIAAARLLDSARKLRLDAALACIDLIEAKAKFALAADNFRTFEEVVRLNQTKVNAGFMPQQELTRSQVAMLQFRSTVKRAELDWITAKTRLQNILGRLSPTDDFDLPDNLKVPLYSGGLELAGLQEAAFIDRPDVQAQQRTQARSRAELKLQLAQAIVDYTVGVEYRHVGTNSNSSNFAGFFFSMPLPLFSRNQGEIARVRAEQEQLTRQARALRAQVYSEVKTAYQEFAAMRELAEGIERDLLQPAQWARDNSAYVYKAGGSTLVEFLDAQRAFNDTMQSYYEAQGAYRRAVLKLNNAVGREVIP